MYAIQTKDLTKEFNGLVAVDHVNLSIERGELFGLLGPNGAGKTTLVHMLCTILPPSDGKGKVWGHEIRDDSSSVRESIGIVFQDPSLDEHLTGRENLDFHARMYGMSRDERERRADELLELVELKNRADSLVNTYSGGMRRRLEMARGLMHRPKVLFLDEPTLGLDPQTRRAMWDYIKMLNQKEGVTTVLTTHYMDEADYLCDRIGIIDYGKIIALDKPSRLKNRLKGDIISLEVAQPGRYAEVFKRSRLVKGVDVMRGALRLSVSNGEKSIPKLIDLIKKHNGRVRSVGLHKPTLEDVFIHYTGRGIREEGEAGAKEGMRLRVRARGR
jgi:ABC-2 type transport system ATP-binding protein